jgi:hypothetical protein
MIQQFIMAFWSHLILWLSSVWHMKSPSTSWDCYIIKTVGNALKLRNCTWSHYFICDRNHSFKRWSIAVAVHLKIEDPISLSHHFQICELYQCCFVLLSAPHLYFCLHIFFYKLKFNSSIELTEKGSSCSGEFDWPTWMEMIRFNRTSGVISVNK